VGAEEVVQRLRERRRFERCEHHRVAHDLDHLDSNERQRRSHLATDEAATDDDRRARSLGALAQLDSAVEGTQTNRALELAGSRARRDHDRLGRQLVERRDRLPEPQVDAVLGVPVVRMHEPVLGLRVAP